MIKIPFFDLHRQFEALRTEILDDLAQVCESQTFILGPKVAELEERIAAFSGAKFGIGTSSGTDAQLLILMALGIGPGDAVIPGGRTVVDRGTQAVCRCSSYDLI